MAHPRKVSIVNLGRGINSEYDDYAPVLNKDETLLIFTSRRQKQNLSQNVHSDGRPFEDIFFSRRNDSLWNDASNIGDYVNTTSHDSNLGLSKDGAQLFIYNSDVNNGDIFVSSIDEVGNWSTPVRLPEPINSPSNENGVSISEDGRWMFFSSDRPGGSGGHDIYVSESRDNDGWQQPVNLGSVINSESNEESPFIGFNGTTLYFSSSGGRGMGGFDIFKSEYDSMVHKWGAPVNLGYPINTPGQDVHFSPTEDGYRAYYATTREDAIGNTDIYEITFIDDKEAILQKELNLQPVTILVRVVDADTEAPIEVEVSLNEDGTNLSIPGFLEEGVWVFSLISEGQKEYVISGGEKGFGFYTAKMTLPGASKEGGVLERIIKIKRLEKDYGKAFRNVYFDFGQSEPR
jgi:hypothetical protein